MVCVALACRDGGHEQCSFGSPGTRADKPHNSVLNTLCAHPKCFLRSRWGHSCKRLRPGSRRSKDRHKRLRKPRIPQTQDRTGSEASRQRHQITTTRPTPPYTSHLFSLLSRRELHRQTLRLAGRYEANPFPWDSKSSLGIS
ncbi:hypothetical protein DERF_004170 [Dermatophagoides farinae]|uniref:Uncharacterized protein n=1 Tax=Dermatophagoides farinae TaxID=6954 RepID=A0A922I4E9_DERFA|nr:hypothetical protein DERF_004170 [Dermatophagoides farinae]